MAIDFKNSEMVKILAPLRSYLAASGVFSMFINILMIVPAIYMLQVFDRAVGSQSVSTLGMLTIIMVALLTAMGFLEWVRGQINSRAGGRLEEILSERTFGNTFRHALFTGGKSSAQPLSDMHGLRNFISGPAINAFFDTPWVPIYIVIMFAFHVYFGLLAVAAVLLLGVLTWSNQRTTGESLKEAGKEQIWTQNYANRHLRNAEVIESMGMMDDVRGRWARHNQRVLGLVGAVARQSGKFTSASRALRITLQSLALGLGAYLAIRQEISPGMMIAGSILLGRALAPVDQLVGAWNGLQAAREHFMRLEDLFARMPPEQERMRLPEPRGRISVEDIRVVPPGMKMPVLKGVSFGMAAGESLGVIGPSGAGKSTLARAILGIWPAAMGTVRLDGADINKWERADLGPHIGYLPQDIELFDGSISENIARLGQISSEKTVAAARMAGVHEMILRLPEGYDTSIGASGGVLAGGQRQRVGLARALYDNPRLVVLDEPNSNLDEVGEAALKAALIELGRQGTTVIVITHRPNILSAVERILVLRDGMVADLGAAELIMRKYQQAPAPQRAPGGQAG